jgi:hypothetical protein
MTSDDPYFTDKDTVLERITRSSTEAKEALDQLERSVRNARELGISWREIGAAQGISKQAVHQKYSVKEPPEAGIEQDTAF